MSGAARTTIAAAGAVVAAMLVLELAYDAPLGDALLFLGYQVAFKLLPGWLLLRALSDRPGSPLRQLALGWALGAALEIGAFLITAALDVRDVFSVYPLLVGIPAAAIAWRRRSPEASDRPPWSNADIWAVAAVCILAMTLFGLAYFPTTPLPGHGDTTYFQDYPWHLGTIAEAKNHWPVTDPNVSGEPYPYHWFAHLHIAGASQVTGIDIPVLYFRLFLLPLVIQVVLLFALAGETLFRSVRIGLGAAAIALFVGDLQLQTNPQYVPHAPFLGVLINLLITSPSFIYGLVIFLALLVVVGEIMRSERNPGRGSWILLGLFLFVATNAKLQLLPVVLLGLGLLALWAVARRPDLLRRVVAIGVLALLAELIVYLWQYAGHSSTFSLDPLITIREMPAVTSLKSYALDVLPSFPLDSTLIGAIGVVFGLVGLFGALFAGIAWLRNRERLVENLSYVWPASILGAGLTVLLLVGAEGTTNQIYSILFGLIGGSLLAAAGLGVAWRTRPAPLLNWTAIALIAGFVALLVVVMRLPYDFDLGFFTGPNAVARAYLVWYAGLACLLACLAFLAWRVLQPRGWWTGALVTLVFLGIGLMGTVANYIAPRFVEASYRSAGPTTVLQPDDISGLTWIRDKTPTDTVIAVDQDNPFRFDFAGFAERRVFIEGWAYASRTLDEGYSGVADGTTDPFAQRRALNRDAFAGDPDAVMALERDYGVRYLVVDRPPGIPVNEARLAKLATPVFRAPGMTVLRIDSPAG